MRIFRFLLRILNKLKTLIFVGLLLASLATNIFLFVGGAVFSALNAGFETVTGIQSIASRNKAEIASLGEDVVVERQAKRELRGQLTEASGDLVIERRLRRELRGQLTEISSNLAQSSAELAIERQGRRQISSQLAETSGDLVIERNSQRILRSELSEQTAELASSRISNRQLKSQVRDFGAGIVPFRGRRVALRTAVNETSETIGDRALRSARRNVSSMPGEALPYLGSAIIVGITALEISDLCATLKDMAALKSAFNPDAIQSENELKVCSIKIPSREEIVASIRASPMQVWESTMAATPSLEELGEMELPDLNWDELWEESKENKDNFLGDMSEFGGQLKKWWE